MSDPIYALSTARGRAGVAVVRLSGDGALAIAQSFVGRKPLPIEGRSLRDLTHKGEVLDRALIVTFAKGASFTGEEIVEFHCHGSVAVVDALLDALGTNARLAEAGEFTKRALMNGELDLAQVEGLADLIDAETELQRRQAMRVFDGALSSKVAKWRKDLIRAVSLIEATIDFADEDIPTDVSPEVLSLIDGVADDLTGEARGSVIAERVREGFEIAIVGEPNIGKSTLLNYLAGRDAAITSEIAGTTRDVIEVRMNLDGIPVTLLDTAGLRETDDKVEAIGVARAMERANAADLRVFLTDGTAPMLEPQDGDIIAVGKVDKPVENVRGVSGKTGQGVDQLISDIIRFLSNRIANVQTATHVRHRIAMERALVSLDAGKQLVEDGSEVSELASAELHRAIHDLSSLIGAVGVEDLLDEIFSSFCLGK